ncbi:hypothetical protein ACER0A_002175 [Haloimpatiens sp. FM7315]|uniref:hypothetical protein n=1 Tax=Haloimpatiens sp. FM7315 TaxID=3298609 RepID=UPI00370C525F
MKLWGYVGKKIKVICLNGKILKGKCTDFTQALDNEPEVDSIGLNVNQTNYELYENEIKSVEVI